MRTFLTAFLAFLFLIGACLAQSPATQALLIQPTTSYPMVQSSIPEAPAPHSFWDKQNKVLFSMVGVSSAADFAVTHYNLSNGGSELNPLARVFCGSTAGQVAYFTAGAAGTMGISYVFHRTGHHKMERYASMLQIGSSTFAASYGIAHR
jgi:hypothetical protein